MKQVYLLYGKSLPLYGLCITLPDRVEHSFQNHHHNHHHHYHHHHHGHITILIINLFENFQGISQIFKKLCCTEKSAGWGEAGQKNV